MFARNLRTLGVASPFILTAACFTLSPTESQIESNFPAPGRSKDGNIRPTQLNLAGVGFRKKKIVLVNFDIYKISFGLSNQLLRDSQNWKRSYEESQDHKPLTTLLSERIRSIKEDSTAAAVNLQFVKSVSTNQIIDAFNDSFIDCNPITTSKFLNLLKSSLGDLGLSAGDNLEFHWLSGGGVLLVVRGEFKGVFTDKLIEKRLLDVYVDPMHTVSPELCKNLLYNLSEDKNVVISLELYSHN